MPMIKVKAQNIMLLFAMIQSAGSFLSNHTQQESFRKKVIMLICIPSLVFALLFSCSAPSNVEKALDG